MTKEALKLALDYIVATNKSSEFWLVPASNLNNVVTAIKEALAQPEQKLWVGMTDEEMTEIVTDIDVDWGHLLWKVVCLTKIIEAKLKEKNT